MTTAAAPVAAAPAAPSNGATSATTEPAAGAESVPQTPAQGAQTQTKPPAPEQPWKAKRKLKIGGKEVEREYDDRRLQILEHEYEKRAETLKKEQELNERFRRLNEDPDGLFAEAGFDVEAYLAQRAQRAEQLRKLSPEQQEVVRLKEQLAKFEQDKARAAEQQRVEAEQREHNAFVQQNVQRLGKAIELSGLPRSGELVRLYAEVQELAAHAGEPEMSSEQIVAAGEKLMSQRLATLLRAAGNEGWRTRNAETLQALAKAVLPALEGKALLDWVGKDFAKRIVAATYSQIKASPTPIIQEPPPAVQTGTQPPANGATSMSDWDILDRLGGG